MSMELMVKAMKLKVGNPLRKLVLIKLADNASDQGECWPSYQHIADQCEVSRRSVMTHIDKLVASGFLRKEIRKGGPKGNTSNLYFLTLDGARNSLGVVKEIHQGGEGDSLPPSERDSPRTSHSFEPVIEPSRTIPENEPETTSINPLGSSGDEPTYCDAFQEFWNEYPKRAGQDSKRQAGKAWNARIRAGVNPDDLINSAKRYAEQCAQSGKLGTEFVKRAATFLGPDEHWRAALEAEPDLPFDEILDVWRESMPHATEVVALGPQRIARIRQLVAHAPKLKDPEAWRKYLGYAKTSKKITEGFCTGDGSHVSFGFDFFTKIDNYNAIKEGRYHE